MFIIDYTRLYSFIKMDNSFILGYFIISFYNVKLNENVSFDC